ncbi:MAG: ParA family protein [Nitrospiraceae bacterium]|nr:ParA family protein [Nitrospiraceae bacterium]
MSRIIAVANQKGGVGKTTTSVNLSSAIAVQGKTVLLVDLDPQGNATSGLGVDPRTLNGTVYHCLIKQKAASDVVIKTNVNGLCLLPANAELAGAEVELVNVPDRQNNLKAALAEPGDRFDFIFIDCPPALGILTINALAAAHSVLIPVQCEYYAMEGLTRLLESIERVRQSCNQALELEGIVLTMFDARNTLSRQVLEQVREHFGEKVYHAVIPRNVALAEAPSYGRPGILYNAASSGSQAYLALAKEFTSHGEESTR